ncbi:MAG: type II toxin-antitoxin system VapC family toxin [Bryobacteraceae bacterium]
MSRVYLLDSHVVVWAMRDPERLSRKAHRLCEDSATKRVISAAALWELAIKASIGAITIRDAGVTLAAWVATLDARVLPVEASHAYAMYGLPMLHKDPFDRMMVAQAKLEDMVLVTNDERIHQYDVKWIW